MTITILKKRKDVEADVPFSDIEEIEIDTFRWDTGHKFHYVRKGNAHFETLRDNEDLIGMKL